MRKLNPSKAIVIFILIVSMLTFFSGIIIPVIYPTVSKFLIVWIPTVFYLYFLGYLAFNVFIILR